MKIYALTILCFVYSACGVFSDEDDDDGRSNATESSSGSDSEEIATDALIVSGSLANGDNPDNKDVIKSKSVEIVRNDGQIVSSATTDDSGNFSIDVAKNALFVDTEFSLTDSEEANKATVRDFSYTLQVKVPDDGSGKALGLRRQLRLTKNKATSTDGDKLKYDLSENKLKQISAIVGTVAFADTEVNTNNVDVFIPGENFFIRTGSDGKFNLLFVPSGTYSIRIQKGIYTKDHEVTVTAGKTTSTGTVTVATTDRNPLPLSSTIIGTWSSTCYYYDMVNGISVESPRTGTVTITSTTSVSITGHSCIFRTMTATNTSSDFSNMVIMSDDSFATKHNTTFYIRNIAGYTNDKITVNLSDSDMGTTDKVEVLVRQ